MLLPHGDSQTGAEASASLALTCVGYLYRSSPYIVRLKILVFDSSVQEEERDPEGKREKRGSKREGRYI